MYFIYKVIFLQINKSETGNAHSEAGYYWGIFL